MSDQGVKSSSFLKKVAPNLYRTATGKYYLLVKRGGKQFRRSLKTTDAALAKRRLREFQEKAVRLTGDGAERGLHFEDLASRWLASIQPELKPNSYHRRVTSLKALSPFFNGHPVRSIGQRQIEAWKIKRGANVSARTWNIETETLRRLLNYAKDVLKIILENPADTIKRKKVIQPGVVIPSKEQFRLLLEELRKGHKATGHTADFVEFLAYSGCRQTEGCNVRWRDVNLKLGTLLITGGDLGTKNYQARTLPLFAPLLRLVESMKARQPDALEDDLVFAIHDARLVILRACERLGLPRYGHHTMRHFFCSNAIEAGCDFKVIAEWLGHKDGGVLVAKTYGHLRNEHSAAMAKRITFDAEKSADEPANIVVMNKE
jgi:integrase